MYQTVDPHVLLTQIRYLDLHTCIPGDILIVTDRMTMAHSLELSVPFLDKKMFQVPNKLPSRAKIANETMKYVLRQTVKRLVSRTDNPSKKLGFPFPNRY